MSGLAAGDRLWFVGLDDGEEKVPAQFATCTGRKFSGFVCATLASGREVIWPPEFFRKVAIDTMIVKG